MNSVFIIYFAGIDGTGKTTLARYLFDELRKRNYNVQYIHWLNGENSQLRRFLRRIIKSRCPRLASYPNGSNTTTKRSTPFITKIFLVAYPTTVLLDYLRFGMIKLWLPKTIGRNKVIVLDRYMYDVILAISKEFHFSDSRKKKLLDVFSKLLPHMDLIFYIDVPPEVSYIRKKDEIKSVQKAKSIWEDYQNFYPLLRELTSGKTVKIDNTGEIGIAKAEVLKNALGVLEELSS